LKVRDSRFATALGAIKVGAHNLATVTRRPAETGAFLRYIAAYEPPLRRLRERFLDEIFPGIDGRDVCLNHRVTAKSLPYGEALVLGAVTAFLRPKATFEIGTFTGGATLIMARHADAEAAIYTLDMPPDQHALQLAGLESDPPESDFRRIGERFRGTEYEAKITQLYGDSATFDFSRYAGKIDLVLIDGSHSYEYVKHDTDAALQMLSSTGSIIWDDCSAASPGVVKALDEYAMSMPIFTVRSTRFALFTRRRQTS
jgi:predicted O-methyltransferase YrrM